MQNHLIMGRYKRRKGYKIIMTNPSEPYNKIILKKFEQERREQERRE